MPNKLITTQDIRNLAEDRHYEYAAVMALIEVESSGHGFSSVTGRMVIQFEPRWFKKEYADWKKHTDGEQWLNNGVEGQTAEWIAFNEAFNIDANAAMMATSMGMMQVMGFHWEELGFNTVEDMWKYAETSEYNQIDIGLRFIKSNKHMDIAFRTLGWGTFAYYYNGAAFNNFKYDTRLQIAYNHYKT